MVILKSFLMNIFVPHDPLNTSYTVLGPYSEHPYSEQIVIFRKIISAPIVNKPKIWVIQKKNLFVRSEEISNLTLFLFIQLFNDLRVNLNQLGIEQGLEVWSFLTDQSFSIRTEFCCIFHVL